VDILFLTGIVLLVLALLGFGGVVDALSSVAWVLLVLGVFVIAWRLIAGRRAA
jgi:uncharacterized membrane protein YtjA (UPF0391 family)